MDHKYSKFAWEMIESIQRNIELGKIIKNQCGDHFESNNEGWNKISQEIANLSGEETINLISIEDSDDISTLKVKSLKKMINNLNYFNIKILDEFLLRSSTLFLYSEFESYFFKCLKFLCLEFPSILNKKQIEIEKISELKGNVDLIKDLKAEEIVRSITMGKIKKIFTFSSKNFGININLSEEDISKLDEFKVVRNIYMHNSGRINQIYILETKKSGLIIGDKIPYNSNDLTDYAKKLFEVILKYDLFLLQKISKLKRFLSFGEYADSF